MSCSSRWTHSGKNKLGWPLVPNFADVDNAESIRIGAGSHPKLRNGDSAAGCRPPGTRSGRAALDGETGYGGAMDPDERDRLNRVVDHEVKGHFPPGAVRRAVLIRHGDEPGVEPGQTRLRVYVLAANATDE